MNRRAFLARLVAVPVVASSVQADAPIQAITLAIREAKASIKVVDGARRRQSRALVRFNGRERSVPITVTDQSKYGFGYR